MGIILTVFMLIMTAVAGAVIAVPLHFLLGLTGWALGILSFVFGYVLLLLIFIFFDWLEMRRYENE